MSRRELEERIALLETRRKRKKVTDAQERALYKIINALRSGRVYFKKRGKQLVPPASLRGIRTNVLRALEDHDLVNLRALPGGRVEVTRTDVHDWREKERERFSEPTKKEPADPNILLADPETELLDPETWKKVGRRISYDEHQARIRKYPEDAKGKALRIGFIIKVSPAQHVLQPHQLYWRNLQLWWLVSDGRQLRMVGRNRHALEYSDVKTETGWKRGWVKMRKMAAQYYKRAIEAGEWDSTFYR